MGTGNVNGRGLGWLRDYPDFRDVALAEPDQTRSIKAPLLPAEKEELQSMLDRVQVALPKAGAEDQAQVDLREWCSPIEDQGQLGSCTANAGVALVEYFERRAFGKHVDASRLFLYKATRNLMQESGDTGAFLRTTMQALVIFGVPPEEYWPYEISSFDAEPAAFCYAFAQNYKSVRYYRLDPPGTSRPDLVARIKQMLNLGLPSMFGFTVYSSIGQADADGRIPFPRPGERIEGGHAVAAVGYDDGMRIRNTGGQGEETTGAFLIRNSWGTSWGDHGYGWLPYRYVEVGLAVDWWSLLKSDWVNTGAFQL